MSPTLRNEAHLLLLLPNETPKADHLMASLKKSFNGLGPFQTASSAAELRQTTQTGASSLAYKSSTIQYTHFGNQTVRGVYVLVRRVAFGRAPLSLTEARVRVPL